MATLVLGAVGTAIGGGFGGAILGLSGAAIGGMVGSFVGGYIDRALISALSPAQRVEGPRLQETAFMGSSEGAPVGRLYGRMRVNGQVIWCTRFKETVTRKTERVGGKGGGGQKVTTKTYTYSVSLAIAFGEGNRKTQLGRVWMDGKEVDIGSMNWRFYRGTESQTPDTLIQSIEGANKTPAFRGITYLVLEDLVLTDYGNRIPQITAEIIRPLVTTDPDDISQIMRGVCLIPGSGEFIYGSQEYVRQSGAASAVVADKLGLPLFGPTSTSPAKSMNVHNMEQKPDFVRSMEQLGLFQDNMETVALVVGWFGDDLRIGNCTIKPKVEFNNRGAVVTPSEWMVDGLYRDDVPQVSLDTEGRPLYGGTPSDSVVTEAIIWLKSKGYRVVFYPFIFMDIPPGNTRPNPYSNNAATVGQPAFPWRGRITCSPAAGYTGTVDKTATASTQVANFFNGTWGLRRMILHYANLCAAAGGVDGFVIGSEMVGMTSIRSSASDFPAVTHLQTLATDVKAIVGVGTKVGYTADWSEYHSYRPNDGTNDVYFNLDPLWSHASIDFIGIDNYMPLADWRDGVNHLDYDPTNNIVSPHNHEYLKANIEGGEFYDWYYASQSDRDNQVRTPIVDVAYSKPWVFRQKDIRNWWLNNHRNRPAGVESGSNTSWVPQSKPIWFTELGCPAIDKGPNQPNAFYDPKSSESFFPYYSTGEQDEYIQRVFLEASLQYWRDNSPTSEIYGDEMISLENILIWCWDARPYPDYPLRSDVWSDNALWRYGHWLTGRLDAVALPRLIEELCASVGVTDVDTTLLNGSQALVKGFNIESIMAVRDMISSLMGAFMFDAFESEGKLKFALRSSTSVTALSPDDYVSTTSDKTGFSVTRTQDTELPSAVKIDYVDGDNDYAVASLDGKRSFGSSLNVASLQLPIVLEAHYVRGLADSIIHQAWTAREQGTVNLPPSMFRFDPGDGFVYSVGSRTATGRFQQINTAEFRQAEFVNFDSSLFRLPSYPVQEYIPQIPWAPGYAIMVPMDIPLVTGTEPSPWSPRVAVWMDPWPGAVAVYREDGSGGWDLVHSVGSRSYLGRLTQDLYAGPTGIWDNGNSVYVEMYTGTLANKTEDQVLNGANALAVQNQDGSWEILQFVTATLTSPKNYTCSQLLRGQLGTEHAMRNPIPAGSNVVLLTDEMATDPNVASYLPISIGDRGSDITLRWGNAAKSVDNDTVYTEGDFVFESVALKPYSPVNFAGAWNTGTNDINLTWMRRTRLNGDSWDVPEVPLNEESELYDLQILAGTTVVREVTSLTSPAYIYTAAMQVADFGALQSSSLKFRVYQISAKVGRGYPGEEIVYR